MILIYWGWQAKGKAAKNEPISSFPYLQTERFSSYCDSFETLPRWSRKMRLKSLSPAAALIALFLAMPTGAQTLDILLPALTFPTDTVTGSSKGCAPEAATPVCIRQE
jgi:hypothetical protein